MTTVAEKMDIQDLYPNFHAIVTNTARRFTKLIIDEELDDLTQTAWEHIIRQYHSYSPEKSALKTWIITATRSALYNMLRDIRATKRKIRANSISLDALVNNRDRFL